MEYNIVFLLYKIYITHLMARIFPEKLLFQDLFLYLSILISSYLAYLNVQDAYTIMFTINDYVVLNIKKLELTFFY